MLHSKCSLPPRLNSYVCKIMFLHDHSDVHNVATNFLLTWEPTQQLFTVLFFLSSLRPWAQWLSLVWLLNYVQRPCLVNDGSFFSKYLVRKLLGQEVDTRLFFLHFALFSTFYERWKLSEKLPSSTRGSSCAQWPQAAVLDLTPKVKFLTRKIAWWQPPYIHIHVSCESLCSCNACKYHWLHTELCGECNSAVTTGGRNW